VTAAALSRSAASQPGDLQKKAGDILFGPSHVDIVTLAQTGREREERVNENETDSIRI
jgi:hypothetical protein